MTVERTYDVIVVGAGTSGSVLAARLSEDPERSVVLLEEGPDHGPYGRPARVLEPSTLPSPVTDREWVTWDSAEVDGDRAVAIPRGRTVGGSSAVNGGYFVRGTRADFDRWAARGAPAWGYDRVLDSFRRLECDLDFGERPIHGDLGPVPVSRAHPLGAVSAAFVDAALGLGHTDTPDLNAPDACGVGPVPRNVANDTRVSAARAYLDPIRPRANLEVRGGVRVRRVVIEHGRAIGVEVDSGRTSRVLRGDQVVLSAGAIGSATLLLRSGVGPAEDLLDVGVEVVVDSPGVGRLRNHPAVEVYWTPRASVPHAMPGHPGFEVALHASSPWARDDGGDVELLPMCRPYGVATGDDPDDPHLSMRVAVQQVDSAGRVRIESAAPHAPPRIELAMLETPTDRARARHGVRLAAEVLASDAFRAVSVTHAGPTSRELASDDELDRWARAHVGPSMHAAGTAAMGAEGDRLAVTDDRCRVRGIEGLRVVDTSLMPELTSRGPAATAFMIGERAAALFDR